jgi:hypothetical protein
VPDDLSVLAQPEFVLVAWAAGLALVSGIVALVRLVGPGFTWMTSALAALVGLAGVLGEDPWWARFGMITLVLGLLWARNRQLSGIFQVTAGLAFFFQATGTGGWAPAASATLALGGVTGEMMLAHWYLVDPRLPRPILKGLALTGVGGVVVDSVVLFALGLPGGGATIAFWVLMATSALLMGAAFAALRYPAYSGVMAATGLSYLAVLTTLAGVFLGRVLVGGTAPFGS